MAKTGSQKEGVRTSPNGPCSDCGEKTGPFKAVQRVSCSGKTRMVRLCESCVKAIKV